MTVDVMSSAASVSYIEGVGDEVTLLFVVLILLLCLSVAWLSTAVTDRPFIHIITVDRRRFQEFLQRFTTSVRSHGQLGVRVITRETAPGAAPPDSSAVPQPEGSTSTATAKNTEESNTEPAPNTTSHFAAVNKQSPGIVVEPVVDSRDSVHAASASIRDPGPDGGSQTAGTSEDSCPATNSGNSAHAELAESGETQKDHANHSTVTTEPSDPCQATQPDTDTERTGQENADTNTTTSSDGVPHTEEPAAGHIRIRLKYLDERQRLVQAKPEETIGQFKSKHFAVELADNFAVRFVFRGKELREDRSTLRSNQIEDNSVIHCLLSRTQQPQQPTPQHQNLNFDLSVLMLPLFAVILSLIWYCRLTYRSYFSAVSTLSLIGITFLFVVSLLATLRRGVHEHED